MFSSSISSPPPQTVDDATESSAPNSTDAVATSTNSLTQRPRRLRRTDALRRMVRETVLTVNDLIYPLFVMEGAGQKQEVPSMPGCFRYSLDVLVAEVKAAQELGIGAIALFPLIPPEQKDNAGTESDNPEDLLPRAIRAIKAAAPQMLVITDVALDMA